MFGERRSFLVRQRAALLKLAGAWDILDAETREPIGHAEEVPPTWAKYLRLLVNKALLPTGVAIRANGAPAPVLHLRKSPGLLRHQVTVTDAAGRTMADFRSKPFSLGGRMGLFGPDGKAMGDVQGNWKGWEFTIRDSGGRTLGVVTKKWAGLAKELFTTADHYLVALADGVPANASAGALLLAVGLAIDLVFKENAG